MKYAFALIWIINGLFFKVLNLLPRHEEIVASILSPIYSREITLTIGILEILMAIWILSPWRSKLCGFIQIVIIFLMNLIEILLVPELLLWGKWNFLFASIFCFGIALHYFKPTNNVELA